MPQLERIMQALVEEARTEYAEEGIVSTTTACAMSELGMEVHPILEQIAEEHHDNG